MSLIPSILKKCIRIPLFLMYSNSVVQKLKGFGFGEISTSAKCVMVLLYSFFAFYCKATAITLSF